MKRFVRFRSQAELRVAQSAPTLFMGQSNSSWANLDGEPAGQIGQLLTILFRHFTPTQLLDKFERLFTSERITS